MSDADRPRDDEDIRNPRDDRTLDPDEETLAGPIPGSPGVPRPPAERDEETVVAGSTDDDPGRVEVDDNATLVDLPATEVPTGEVSLDRDDATQHAGLAETMQPGAADDRDADATVVDMESRPGRESKTLAEDEETLSGDLPSLSPDAVSGTQAEAFGGTQARPQKPHQTISDEGETVFEPGATEAQSVDPNATVTDGAAGTQRRGPPATEVGTHAGASATARDAAADGFTERGGRQAGGGGPIRLAEGEYLGNRYILDKRLGKGGMGEVWKARHRLLKGDRAIKVIKASISRDTGFRDRFVEEGATMMSIKHPGVVAVTDLDQTRMGGELYMVMEYLEGRTLYDAIRDNDEPLSADVRNVVRIYKELADGMQVIHDRRIVHKDLKSDNALLVVGDDGLEHPKVIDFGLAKRLEDDDGDVKTGDADVEGGYEPDLRTTLSGTLAYMAPEQFLGRPSSFQSDIYAWGVMFQECFTKGEYPLPRGGLAHYLELHAEGAKPAKLRDKRSDLDPFLAELSDRCMAVKREDRPASFQEVSEQLQEWLDRPEKLAKRRRLMAQAAVVLFLISTTLAAYFMAGDSASLGPIRAVAAGRKLQAASDERLYLSADSLATLRISAAIEGEPESPKVLVNGDEVVAEIVHDETANRLSATADLSGLEDGVSELTFVPAPGGASAKLTIVVDRQAPTIRTLDVPGARDGFVAAENPPLRLVVDETTVASVTARVEGGESAKGTLDEADGSGQVWRIPGTSLGEGRLTKVDVEVIDHAGNRSSQRIAYTQDTTPPAPRIQDLRDAPDGDGKLLPVRTGVGAEILIWVKESGSVTLTAADATFEHSHGVGSVLFDLPAVPAAGYSCTLVSEDLAGNRVEERFRVEPHADVARLTSLDGAVREASVDGTADVTLSLRRFYALGTDNIGLSAARTHDPDGNLVKEAASEIAVQVGAGTAFSVEILVPRGELTEGTWKLTPTGQGEATPEPFTLTLDPSPPVIHGVVTRTAGGVELAQDQWAHTRDLVVAVDASDLALESIALEGASAPRPAPVRGRATYTFDLSFAEDGRYTRVLKLQDAAGNSYERPLRFRVDATNPGFGLTPLGAGLDNKNPVDFVAQATEPDCTLHVTSPTGIRGGAVTARADAGSRDLRATGQLIAGQHDLTVWVTDPAGRESVRLSVAVDVDNLETKLPERITWPTGVTAEMRKIAGGDVVVEGRIFPVSEGYVDHSEVTNGEYRAYLSATGDGHGDHCHADEPEGWDHTPDAETWADARWSRDVLPVVNVAYWDAYAFSKWSGRRLPREAEWVKAAAKQEGELDLRRYPFGNTWQDGVLVTAELLTEEPFQGPRDAKTGADVSPNSCLHLGGNVSEWVDLDRVPEGEPDVAARGGNWYLSKVAAAIGTHAIRYPRSLRAATIGFRCAVDGQTVRDTPGITGPKE